MGVEVSMMALPRVVAYGDNADGNSKFSFWDFILSSTATAMFSGPQIVVSAIVRVVVMSYEFLRCITYPLNRHRLPETVAEPSR